MALLFQEVLHCRIKSMFLVNIDKSLIMLLIIYLGIVCVLLPPRQLQPLRQALSKCKEDNSKMAGSMESLMHSNTKLQATVDKLQDELAQKAHMLDSTNRARSACRHFESDAACLLNYS